MSVVFKISGLEEIKRRLAEVSDNVERRYSLIATAAATATIRDQVVANAPVYTGEVSKGHPKPGTLKKAIKIGRQKGLGGGRVGYYIYVQRGKKAKRDAYYAGWVEFGHYTKGAKRFKYRAGRGSTLDRLAEETAAHWVEPNPFMRRALDAQWRNAVDRFKQKMTDQLRPDGLK